MKKEKKSKKKNSVIKILFILLILVAFIKIVPTIILNIGEGNIIEIISKNNKKALEDKENINFEVNNSNLKYIIDNKKLSVYVTVDNLKENSIYTILYGVEDDFIEEELSENKTIELELKNEGANNCYIAVKRNENIVEDAEWNDTYYYIDSYKKQFLDELENKGVVVHVVGTNVNKFMPIYKSFGSQFIRADIRMDLMKINNQLGFSHYDRVIPYFIQNNIKVLCILGTSNEQELGEDKIISNDEELEKYKNYISAIAEHYPEINDYEIINEPNAEYMTEEQIEWYAKALDLSSKLLKQKNPNINILSGVISYGRDVVKSSEFINKVAEYSGYENTDSYSYHIYDFLNKGYLNTDYKYKMEENKSIANDLGGFIKNSNTEYGLYSYPKLFSEYDQATKVVQQSVLGDYYDMYISTIYNFRDSGTDENNIQHNFGLTRYTDYTPKLAYYSQKKYYENTNGAEYIGTISLADDLEFHVYDKDGKPKVVAWSSNTNNTINMEYDGFSATDMYGDPIENTDGVLKITSEPVYLDNISTNCFYKAISEIAIDKINSFEEKYSDEISNVVGLMQKLELRKTNMQNISSLTSVTEEYSKTEMESLFDLGNLIIEAYKSGKLDIEYVRLSSMLDSLNDIGNSYEDLVTVSAETRNANLIQTNEKIEEVENLLSVNEDLEIIYPNKILKFSKDLYEKANYINELEEENSIKTGLIVSKNMHSNYLASWAKEFAYLYVDKSLGDNLVQITYSKTNLTNKDVKATLVSDKDIQIINNSGSNEYVFKENGEFEFIYSIRNKQFTIKAKVNNIDKTEPTITGVIPEKTYTTAVTPVIEDENLDKVELKVNGITDSAYEINTSLNKEGIYELSAIDKAGNKITITFQIIENLGDGYKIKDNIVTNIMTDTNFKNFKSVAKLKEDDVIIRNGVKISENDKVVTGDILTTSSNDEYTLIVAGDINKDGKTTIKDVVRLTRYLLGDVELDDIEKIAADANCDNKELGIKDVVRLKIYTLGRVDD